MNNPLNLHRGTNIWHFVQEGHFTLSYDFLERAFDEQAKKEGVIEEKHGIRIKELELDEKTRNINIKTEIYRLLEN